MRRFFLLTTVTAVLGIETCQDLKTLYQGASIAGGGNGCCGNDDASLDIPECDAAVDAIKEHVQPIATLGIPPDVPSAALVRDALDFLPTHIGIEKALSAPGYEYTFPFGDNVEYFVKTCSYWGFYRDADTIGLRSAGTRGKGDALPDDKQYNDNAAKSLQRFTKRDGKLLLTSPGGMNQDAWGSRAFGVTRSWYREGMVVTKDGDWEFDARYNTWITYIENTPKQYNRWLTNTSSPDGGFWQAETDGPAYVLDVLDAETMQPVPHRSTWVCRLSKFNTEFGFYDITNRDNVGDPGPGVPPSDGAFGMETFQTRILNQTYDASMVGAWDDTDLFVYNTVLVQAACKYIFPDKAGMFEKQLLSVPTGQNEIELKSTKSRLDNLLEYEDQVRPYNPDYTYGLTQFRTPAMFKHMIATYPTLSFPFKAQIKVSQGTVTPTYAMQCPGSQGLYVWASGVSSQGFSVANSTTGAIEDHPSFPRIVNAMESIHASEVSVGYDFHSYILEGWPATTGIANVYPGTDANGVPFNDLTEPNMKHFVDQCANSSPKCDKAAAVTPAEVLTLTKDACEAVFEIAADIPSEAREAATLILRGYANTGFGFHIQRIAGILGVPYTAYLPDVGCSTLIDAAAYNNWVYDPTSPFTTEQIPLFNYLPQNRGSAVYDYYVENNGQWPTKVDFAL